MRGRQVIFFLLAIVSVVILDQWSKEYAHQAAWPNQLNHGISFGLFSGFSGFAWGGVLFIVLMGLWVAWREWWLDFPVGSGLFFGGALSNLADRLIHGGVRDWIPVPFTNLHNNLADWAVVFGLLLIFLMMWRSDKHQQQLSQALQKADQNRKSAHALHQTEEEAE